MLKRIILAVVQFIVFLILLGIGGYWDVVRLVIGAYIPSLRGLTNLLPLLRYQITAAHVLVANGILFAGILCAIILLIETLRRSSRSAKLITLLTYLAAVVFSLAIKIGLPPTS